MHVCACMSACICMFAYACTGVCACMCACVRAVMMTCSVSVRDRIMTWIDRPRYLTGGGQGHQEEGYSAVIKYSAEPGANRSAPLAAHRQNVLDLCVCARARVHPCTRAHARVCLCACVSVCSTAARVGKRNRSLTVASSHGLLTATSPHQYYKT